MEKSTFVGTLAGTLLIVVSIQLTGTLLAFVDIPSFLVVAGGGVAASFIGYSIERTKIALLNMKECYFAPKEFNNLKAIRNILVVADIARKEGILSLDSRLAELEDPFMVRGLQMVVDGVDIGVIEEILTTELDWRANRHSEIKEIIDFMGAVFPAFGLIGTIMGLVNLLGNLEDVSTIGPNMALALVTTFYGAVVSNMFAIPLSKKVEERSRAEGLYGEIIARGCLMIAGGMHPRIIRERLLAFLSNISRAEFSALNLDEELRKHG